MSITRPTAVLIVAEKLRAERIFGFDKREDRAMIDEPQLIGENGMSAVQRHAEAAEEMRFDLVKIATDSGAIKMDEEGEHFVSCNGTDAVNHAFARATNRWKQHAWDADIQEVRETLKDILDEARYGDRFKDRWTPTYT
jgi:hypothetical protein